MQQPGKRLLPAAVAAALATAAAIVAVVLGPAPAAAQEEDRPAVFGEVIDVRVINLEVVVTDKAGGRVTGLTTDDFQLLVDGEEVPIEYFTEVHGGTAVERGDEAVQTAVPALAPGIPVSTSYLVFIDDFFTVASLRNRILETMIDQLPLMQPEDRMAVVAFDGKRLEMLSTWSQSVETLTRVLQEARDRKAFGLQRLTEQRAFETGQNLPGNPLIETDPSRLNIEERARAEEVAEQVERVVMAASAALRSFAKPPGRKVMLMLAGGWPYDPARWVVGDDQRAIFDNIPSGDQIYQPLIDTANRLSYSLYPVDVPGLRPYETSIDKRTVEENDLARNRLVDRTQGVQSTLWTLAAETGGRALVGSASRVAFERVVEDTRSYYWLGFTPSWKGDDESHRVIVKPLGKGLKLRARKSYSDLSRETEVTMMVESSLLFGDSPSSTPLKVQAGAGKRAGLGKVSVPFRILIPMDLLTFLPGGKGYVADTELRFAVLDEQGATSEIPVIPLSLRLEELPKEGTYSLYATNLLMRKRRHDVVVSLYDKPSGTILSAKLEVDPKKQ